MTFFLALSVFIGACAATPYDTIKTHILQNFPAIKLNQHIAFTKKKDLAFPAVALSDYEKHEALFTLLSGTTEQQSESIIDTQTMSDLSLFFYNAHRPNYTILEKIYRGSSLNGKIAQAVLLAQPTDQIAKLHGRQALILYLMQNKPLCMQLMALFKELAALEEQLYSLWNTDDILYTNYVKKTFYKGNFKKYSGVNGAFWLECNRRKKDFKPIIDFLVIDTINTIIRTFHMKYARGIDNPSTQPGWLKAFTSIKKEGKTLSTKQKKAKHEENIYAGLSTAVSLLPIIIEYDQWRRSMRAYQNLANHIRMRTQALVIGSKIIQSIFTLISHDTVIQENLDHYIAIQNFALGTNPQQDAFLRTIKSPAFQSRSYHFSYVGKVLHAIPQFLDLKQSFSEVFRSIGQLEAYLSIATFMREKESSPTPWCFVTYCHNTTPYLAFTDYYHPFIPSETAVLNSIELGNNKSQGMIVTGPNASGKSISIRAIALCVLLGQSLGIAPAKQAAFTPMSKILTYLNLVDNIAQGRSLFQAEEDRIYTIVHDAYTLPLDKFSFIVIDELLSSTAPAEGEAASFGICYGLSKCGNCMPIAATHFARLTSLPRHTNRFFANYHVSVIRKENGDIQHTFKLDYGSSRQVIAIDLARQAGLDSDILMRAQEFLHQKGIKRDRTVL